MNSRIIIRDNGFSALHCITFTLKTGETVSELVHGHDFRFNLTVSGPLNEDQMVLDFSAVSAIVRLAELHFQHKFLLQKSPFFSYSTYGENTEIVFNGSNRRKWSFPTEDIFFLSESNTTTEIIAEVLLDLIVCELEQSGILKYSALSYGFRLELEESPGMSAVAVRGDLSTLQ